MKKETITLDDGRRIDIREMTWAEARRIRAEGETLPMEWPLEEQFRGREAEMDGLGVSEIRELASAVYRLTFAEFAPLAPALGAPPVGDTAMTAGRGGDGAGSTIPAGEPGAVQPGGPRNGHEQKDDEGDRPVEQGQLT